MAVAQDTARSVAGDKYAHQTKDGAISISNIDQDLGAAGS
jgi:hypothetical protein